MIRTLAAAFLLALAAMACAGDVVATVGNVPIGRREVETTAKIFALQRDSVLLNSPEQQTLFREHVIHELIDQYLLSAAASSAGVTVRAEDVEEYIEAHKGRYTDDSFHTMLAGRGIDEATWRLQRERQLLVERYIAEVIAPAITITDHDIATYYQNHEKEFRASDAIQVRHILVTDRATAERLRERLHAGENFAQLAVEFSIAPEAERGGDVGWIQRGQYPQVFEDTCFQLPVGAMSDVVQSQYGFHLFKVLARRRATTLPLTAVKEDIAARLREDATAEAFAEHMATLRSATAIAIRDEALARVTLPLGAR